MSKSNAWLFVASVTILGEWRRNTYSHESYPAPQSKWCMFDPFKCRTDTEHGLSENHESGCSTSPSGDGEIMEEVSLRTTGSYSGKRRNCWLCENVIFELQPVLWLYLLYHLCLFVFLYFIHPKLNLCTTTRLSLITPKMCSSKLSKVNQWPAIEIGIWNRRNSREWSKLYIQYRN